MINLFDSKNSQVDYANFNGVELARADVDTATGKWAYTLGSQALGTTPRFMRDHLRSRWQAQMSLRFRF